MPTPQPSTTSHQPQSTLRQLVSVFASLKLTVLCLLACMGLVLLATFAQKDHGIFYVKQVYFDTFFVWWFPPGWHRALPVFPGGFLVGSLLLINLLVAHFTRFNLAGRKFGMWMIHGGMILLIAGMFFSSILTVETRLELDEGQTKNYTEDPRHTELIVVDTSNPDYDQVVSFPQSYFKHDLLQHPDLPFDLRIQRYYPNSQISMRPPDSEVAAPATQGMGKQLLVVPLATATANDEINIPTLIVEPIVEGKPAGTFALTNALMIGDTFNAAGKTWRLQVRQRRYYLPYSLTLRDFRHDKYPGTQIPRNFSSLVTLAEPGIAGGRDHLISMNHPLRHAGKTYYQSQFKNNDKTSILQVVDNPGWLMPYISCTLIALGLLLHFLQSLSRYLSRRAVGAPSAVGPGGDGAGDSSGDGAGAPPAPGIGWPAWLAGGLAVAYLAAGLLPDRAVNGFDLESFRRLPVLLNGRIKPMDTVGRSTLVMLRGKQSIIWTGPAEAIAQTDEALQSGGGDTPRPSTEEQTYRIDSTEWLLDTLARPEKADTYPIFMINNPDVLTLLGLTEADGIRNRFFSYAKLLPGMKALEEEADKVEKIAADKRDPFEKAANELYNHVLVYHRLKNTLQLADLPGMGSVVDTYSADLRDHRQAFMTHAAETVAGAPELQALLGAVIRWQSMSQLGYLRIAPPADDAVAPAHGESDPANLWQTQGEALFNGLSSGQVRDISRNYAALVDAWREQDAPAFNDAVKAIASTTDAAVPAELRKAGHEVLFNRAEPFYRSLVLYVIAFLCAAVGWLMKAKDGRQLQSAAFAILLVAFIYHTLGLIARVYLQGYAPVTNLYSSAVFVGWAAVLVGLILERLHGNGIGNAAAASVGFATLVIAHNLSKSGDTMEMMRAVLDSNFWLSTHVVTVTIGYSGMFLAGLLATFYILQGVFTRRLDRDIAKALSRNIYGVICFSTLLSFVGTILGGIWADQSWGRFWGWDPKENGAMLIVLWCAIMLHGRWGGMLRDRGVAVAAVFGCIVTAFSWFGTNMLGVGLHSYGFTDKGFVSLMGFNLIMLMIIGFGLIPLRMWPSFATVPTVPATRVTPPSPADAPTPA